MANTPNYSSRVGEIVAGRYRVDKIIGSGGQGAVFRATDLKDSKIVALKVLHPGSRDDKVAQQRILREIHALVVLRGTAAVDILDQAFANDGSLVIVLEYLQGEDLNEHCNRLEEKGERISIPAIIQLLTPVVDTIEKAHSCNIIHRDLKPANIFVLDSAQGNGVRVLDFGYAKFTEMASLTATGMVAGSPSYIAPETWRGERPNYLVDVYSLGAVIFRTLAGDPPFEDKNIVSLMKKVIAAPRPSLTKFRADLPVTIDAWVKQALESNPSNRFQSVRALWTTFLSIIEPLKQLFATSESGSGNSWAAKDFPSTTAWQVEAIAGWPRIAHAIVAKSDGHTKRWAAFRCVAEVGDTLSNGVTRGHDTLHLHSLANVTSGASNGCTGVVIGDTCSGAAR